MTDKDQARLVITFKSASMMKRLEKESDRLGLPKSTLAILALDGFLPQLPPAPVRRRPYKRPDWAPSVAKVAQYFKGEGLAKPDLVAGEFVKWYDNAEWRTSANKKLRGWRNAASRWARDKDKVDSAPPVAADLGLGDSFLSDEEY